MSLTWDVLIPAYNAEAGIGTAVASALAQPVPPQRVLVYDDGSSDRTVDAARAAGAEVLVGPENRGVGHARQELLEAAQAPWVHMLDADDRLLPGAYRLFEQADATHPGAWLHGFGEVPATGSGAAAGGLLGDRPVDVLQLWLRNRFITSSTLIRRAAALEVGGFPRTRQVEDYALWLTLAAAPGARGRLWTYDSPVTARAYDGGSLTGDVTGAVRAERQLLPQHAAGALAGVPGVLRPALTTARLSTLWWRGLSRHTDYGRPASSYLPAREVVPGTVLPAVLGLVGSGPARRWVRAAAGLAR
ncbi:glycosyltransferase family 2 protein [Modestobacter sp. I12A-02662]|uniref:glycosyltransferase family 2 protein n=1 Tax=Modestobacter sp. I12A-02662 TaxID=1730496 RepID=UPI0034DF0786